MINFNTDLADERRDIFKKANKIDDEVPGIETEEKVIDENVKLYRVKILDKQGENALGKPIEVYTTIDVKNLKLATDDDIQKASDSLDMFIEKVKQIDDGQKLFDILNSLTGNEKYEMIKEVLIPNNYNLIVTPKEIDDLIENMSSVVARGINFAV